MSYLGQELGQGKANRETFTATGGETSVNVNYSLGQLSVYLNGVKLLESVDFVATNGTSITGLTALAANDVMDFVSLDSFSPADTVSAASGGTFTGPVVFSSDITVNGTTTTLNTQTVEVEDNILQLNTTQASPDTATAATSGFSVYRGNGVTLASLIFDDADDTWDLTNNIVVAGNSVVTGTINGTDINNADRVTNLGVGITALDSITTGDSNVALGDNALTSCTDGYFNSATGRYAMENTTSANQNAALGYSALRLNETGIKNTAMGAKALQSAVTGDFNTACGYYALYLTNGANLNTALGFDAGKSIVGGNNNTVLGAKAGDNITTGSSNIIIGYNIDAGSATGSNQLNIGDTIYGDLSNKRVGIGTTAPSKLLSLKVDNLTAIDVPFRIENSGAGSTLANSFTAIQFAVGDTNAGPSESAHIGAGQVGESGTWNTDSRLMFWVGNAGPTVSNAKIVIDGTGHTYPGADNTQDLGSASKQWRNIYTGDLHLKNERGSWTVIEEEDYLTLRNNKTDKIYKLVMEEIE